MSSVRLYTPEHPELGTAPMPIRDYVAPESFEREREVFRHAWLHVGRVEELPAPGNYFVQDVLACGVSILITRGADNQLRAFHNVCRHRGNKLVWDRRGSTLRHPCKFHGWNYSPQGQLIGVPEEDQFFDLDRDHLGLRPVALDVWEGFIFISLDPRESLREFLGEVAQLAAGYDMSRFPVCYVYSAEVRANWKIVRDSQLEGYHAKYLHRRAAPGLWHNRENPSRHTVAARLFKRHNLLSMDANLDRQPPPIQKLAGRYGVSLDDRAGSNTQLPPGINPSRSANWYCDLIYIFPTFHFEPFADMCITHQTWPIAFDRSIWEGRLYLPKGNNLAEWFSRDYSKCLTRDVWMEDGSTLENTHFGLASGAITEQLLQDQEIMIRHADKVLKDELARLAATQRL